LLAHLLGVPRASLLAHDCRLLSVDERRRYTALVERRAAHEPVAYLVGHRAFYDVDLMVDARVLIPRPETEHLVESALAWARAQHGPVLRIVDVGTGSGAIALVLARHLAQASVWAVDRSAGALEVARANLERYGVASRVSLVQSDLLSELAGPFDLIAANLPYVTSVELPTLAADVLVYEPQLALDGGPDGLSLIERLVFQARDRLACPGLLLLEIDPRQAERVRALAAAALPDAETRTLCDYAGWERVVRIERRART
ncbi:MAG: peptide chain release factor N(5)-glutamine methyltransferase, partial [Chloroflexi bacterium]|nr:peptide chain release factor N(5)-glutamine methyltransferase [Chloroflexota bacterium]